ncbi:MAG: DUF2125 domain-containing protein [Hyphomonadaceae bacterium]|nr:DUF2125 domain-containing protein [Hyphomonadaceae bacterium]
MKARNLFLIIPWALFIAAALGWIFYWNYLASEAERRVHAWQFEQNASGATVEIGQVIRHGFPVFLRLELRDVRYVASRGGWRAETGRADLNSDPLKPQHAILEAKAPISITRANGAATNVRADALIASVRMDGDRLAEAGVEANNLVLDDPAEEGVLHAERVMASVRPDPRAASEYQFSFEAQTITLPRPVRSFEAFGLDVARMHAAIVVTQGALLMQSSPGDPLGPWRDGGGRLRFEGLELNWGPLQTTGTGEGGLDAQRRLDGRLVLPVDRPAPVLTAIANGPNIDRDARRALTLLAAGYVVTGNDITLDISAYDGVLRVEGLPVRPLPPVY